MLSRLVKAKATPQWVRDLPCTDGFERLCILHVLLDAGVWDLRFGARGLVVFIRPLQGIIFNYFQSDSADKVIQVFLHGPEESLETNEHSKQ